MDKFQQGFINEANDLLISLESALLSLENDKENSEVIGEVFRVMHSLKGTSSMFGFDIIGAVTHHLESIYDLIRAGKLVLTTETLTASFSALDLIKKLLEDSNLEDTQNKAHFDKLQVDIVNIVNIVKGVDGTDSFDEVEIPNLHKIKKVESYYVKVEMDKEIFLTGSNPLYLIDDLVTLGEAKIKTNLHLPTFKEFNFEHCYTSWEVILVTDQERNEIDDVFMFVEDECKVEVTKISNSNIFDINSLEQVINDFLENKTQGIQEIQRIVENELEKKKGTSRVTKTKGSIRVDVEMIDELMNLVSQLVTTQASLNLYADKEESPFLEEIAEGLDKLTRKLRDNAFSMSLMSLDSLFTRFQRLVRDTSNDLNKPIEFKTVGKETKLDKKIIETLSEPLMHILRNSLDHGIETAEQRELVGKPSIGKIEVAAYNSGPFVHISVKDDGGGINIEKVRAIAIDTGIIKEKDNLSEQEIKELIFAPGFTTAESVTDLSGRGVGMDVVKISIESVRGEIILDSQIGVGTEVTLRLPLTLSIVDGLLVQVGLVKYAIPLLAIDRCIEIKSTEISKNSNGFLFTDNEKLPYFDLREKFKTNITEVESTEVVIVWSDGDKFGLIVDHIIDEVQVVLKPLGKYYKQSEMFSGATILGDGIVALVIDPEKMVSFFNTESIEL